MAAKDFASLAARLNEARLQIVVGVEGYVAEVCEEIGVVLVPATPVDTGYARGNWRPSLNAPAAVPTTLVDPDGAATVARIGSVARQFRVGQTFFLVNRVPYIGLLNDPGTSRQAPRFFVQRSVQAAIDAVSRRRSDRGLF